MIENKSSNSRHRKLRLLSRRRSQRNLLREVANLVRSPNNKHLSNKLYRLCQSLLALIILHKKKIRLWRKSRWPSWYPKSSHKDRVTKAIRKSSLRYLWRLIRVPINKLPRRKEGENLNKNSRKFLLRLRVGLRRVLQSIKFKIKRHRFKLWRHLVKSLIRRMWWLLLVILRVNNSLPRRINLTRLKKYLQP